MGIQFIRSRVEERSNSNHYVGGEFSDLQTLYFREVTLQRPGLFVRGFAPKLRRSFAEVLARDY